MTLNKKDPNGIYSIYSTQVESLDAVWICIFAVSNRLPINYLEKQNQDFACNHNSDIDASF